MVMSARMPKRVPSLVDCHLYHQILLSAVSGHLEVLGAILGPLDGWRLAAWRPRRLPRSSSRPTCPFEPNAPPMSPVRTRTLPKGMPQQVRPGSASPHGGAWWRSGCRVGRQKGRTKPPTPGPQVGACPKRCWVKGAGDHMVGSGQRSHRCRPPTTAQSHTRHWCPSSSNSRGASEVEMASCMLTTDRKGACSPPPPQRHRRPRPAGCGPPPRRWVRPRCGPGRRAKRGEGRYGQEFRRTGYDAMGATTPVKVVRR